MQNAITYHKQLLPILNNWLFNLNTKIFKSFLPNQLLKNYSLEYFMFSDIFSNEITEKYIDLVQRNNSWLIWNVLRMVPVTGIKVILVDILKAGKSIKDIVFVFEKICEYASENKDFATSKDPYRIAERVKKDLV